MAKRPNAAELAATRALLASIHAVGELQEFIGLVAQSLTFSARAPEMINALVRYAKEKGGDLKNRKSPDYDGLARVAKKHNEAGNSYLFSLAAVRLWTVLESGMAYVYLALLRDESRYAESKAMKSLTGPLLEFTRLSREKRQLYLLEALFNEVRARRQPGVAQFEAMLEILCLGGGCAPVVRKAILRLEETRHLLVHRQGVVDQKFLRNVPWLKAEEGVRLSVSVKEYEEFSLAVLVYLNEVASRLEKPLLKKNEKTKLTGHIDLVKKLEEREVRR